MRWTLAVIPAILVGVAWNALYFSTRPDPPLADWLTYVHGSQMVLSGQSPYSGFQLAGPYRLDAASNGLGYVYPPSAALVMAPFLPSAHLWILAGLVLMVTGTLAAIRVERPLTPGVVAVVMWVYALLPGTSSAVYNGAVTMHLVGILGITYAGASSVLAGWGGAVKLMPGAWLLWHARTDWRRAIPGVAVAVIAALATLPLIGTGPWLNFPTVLANGEPICRNSPSLRCLGATPWVGYTIAAVLLGMSLTLPRRAAFAMFPLAMLAAAPDIGGHMMLFGVPALAVLMGGVRRPAGRSRRSRSPWGSRTATSDAGSTAPPRCRPS